MLRRILTRSYAQKIRHSAPLKETPIVPPSLYTPAEEEPIQIQYPYFVPRNSRQ